MIAIPIILGVIAFVAMAVGGAIDGTEADRPV